MNDWPPQIWAALVALAGTLAAWAGRKSNNRADAASVLTDGALKMFNELQEEVTRLRKDRDHDRARLHRVEVEQEEEREWCDLRINQLVFAMRDAGLAVPIAPVRNHKPRKN